MQYDVNELCKFYEGKFGKLASKFVQDEINIRWENLNGLNVLGFGYARPYLNEIIVKNPQRAINYNFPINYSHKNNALCKNKEYWTPHWTPLGKNLTVIGEEDNIPFEEATFDRIVAIHALEDAQNTQRMLRELWRILAPEGRIIFIVPNRRGFLARNDNTPFGQGRPYSKTQLSDTLSEAMFEITYAKRIFFAPPIFKLANEKFANFCEELGKCVLPHVGGLLFIEATKRVAIEPNKIAGNKTRLGEMASATYFSKHENKQPK